MISASFVRENWDAAVCRILNTYAAINVPGLAWWQKKMHIECRQESEPFLVPHCRLACAAERWVKASAAIAA